jgi:hypothetical protein
MRQTERTEALHSTERDAAIGARVQPVRSDTRLETQRAPMPHCARSLGEDGRYPARRATVVRARTAQPSTAISKAPTTTISVAIPHLLSAQEVAATENDDWVRGAH